MSLVNAKGLLLPTSLASANRIWGGANPDLVGTAKADQITGGGPGYSMAGGLGDDIYYVKTAGDRVIENAGAGVDTVVTNYLNYILPDDVENLTVTGNYAGRGNAGDNIILGLAGDQILEGMGGNDVLIGGPGSDVFVFSPGSGHDLVSDYTSGDRVRIDGYGFSTFTQVQSAMTESGGDVVLKLSAADSVIFRNHKISDFASRDFQLEFNTSALKLTFNEDFNSLSLWNSATDEGVWKTNFKSGSQDSIWSGYSSRTLKPNNEQQLYVDPLLKGTGTTPLGLNPFSVEDGVLNIHAGNTPEAVKSSLWGYDYTSGLITTENSFSQLYGYFEIKVDLPEGKGIWPAFWLLPTDGTWPPELDVFEHIGGQHVHGSAHSGLNGHTVQTVGNWMPDVTEGFHTFGMMWSAKEIGWFMDGVLVKSVATPADLNKPMYMLVNMAVGGNWPGSPPQGFTGADLKVDYVRAYSIDPNAAADELSMPAASPVSVPPASPGAKPNDVVAADVGADASGNTPEFGVAAMIQSAFDIRLPEGIADLELTGFGDVRGEGNGLDNFIRGNAGANSLIGGAGNDTLDGGKGVDSFAGGAGDDVYILDTASELIFEMATGGVDTVIIGTSFTLPDNIENLAMRYSGGATGRGNALANSITGNEGANLLDGYAGNDTIEGRDGGDTIVGGAGDDKLTGGGGADVFRFLTGSGRDVITDFGAGGEMDVIDIASWRAYGYDPKVSYVDGDTLIMGKGHIIQLVGVSAEHLVQTDMGYAFV